MTCFEGTEGMYSLAHLRVFNFCVIKILMFQLKCVAYVDFVFQVYRG